MSAPSYTAVVSTFARSSDDGISTTDSQPARAAAAATALARLPVDGQASTRNPSWRAAASAPATTRSLNECVGLPVSSLTHKDFTPSAAARRSAFTSRVRPGSVLGCASTSDGTGSSLRYRQMDLGPASISARVTFPNSYETSSGPKHSAQANSGARGIWLPHSRQLRARAGPRSSVVVPASAVIVIARYLLICPAYGSELAPWSSPFSRSRMVWLTLVAGASSGRSLCPSG